MFGILRKIFLGEVKIDEKHNPFHGNEHAKELIKSAGLLLGVKFYDRRGDMTEEGKKYVLVSKVRNEYYDGEWDKMRKDLNQAVANRPYIFKLAQRIKEDIERIDKLEEVERVKKDITDVLAAYSK